jgi:hypothetical protein
MRALTSHPVAYYGVTPGSLSAVSRDDGRHQH